MNRQLRHKISQILIKWDMPTRQAAIGEIMSVFREDLSEIVKEIEGLRWSMETQGESVAVGMGIKSCVAIIKKRIDI